MQHHEPDILHNLRTELVGWRSWLDRAVVLAAAALAGLLVVGFTLLTQQALHLFGLLWAHAPWALFVAGPLCAAAIVGFTRRWLPGAGGSGIPQVMAALDTATPPERYGLFVSLRISVAKVLLSSAGLLAGLSIGREGPSVQVAAGVMLAARRWLSARTVISAHGLLVAGGAAGVAAAFNTPLGGVLFAIEQLSRTLNQRSSGLLIAAIVLAGLIAVSVFGNLAYFGVIRVPALGWELLGPGLLVTVAAALLGGLFARLMIASMAGGADRFSAWRQRWPIRFAAGCALAVAVIGAATGGATFGSGYEHTRALLEGDGGTAHQPGLFVLLKFAATWLSAWSGVPGGIFAPSLSIGAGVGHDVAWLLQRPELSSALIAMGMAAFLSAVTQAPITAFIIVMEMVAGHTMVLSLMAASMLASLISRQMSRPLYEALAQLQLRRLEPVEAVPKAQSEEGASATGASTPRRP
ncbi:chloride channel protein [Azohydromonas caseinilytica]|uniref:Chloride channel protein n=1 Tax=Azohydromonas caseinilytica TaxID=2728836 RepID=A0A848F7A1_9BURK|nr:chloride channel protein [Azohydromonas caseinilytica]NML13941.1 chloride channel protein [Azohydromonas caseinilytica]